MDYFENPLALLVISPEHARAYKSSLFISDADDARGITCDAIVWFRKPTQHEQTIVLNTLRKGQRSQQLYLPTP